MTQKNFTTPLKKIIFFNFLKNCYVFSPEVIAMRGNPPQQILLPGLTCRGRFGGSVKPGQLLIIQTQSLLGAVAMLIYRRR